jgi:hypothetical protein
MASSYKQQQQTIQRILVQQTRLIERKIVMSNTDGIPSLLRSLRAWGPLFSDESINLMEKLLEHRKNTPINDGKVNPFANIISIRSVIINQ